MRAIGSPNHYTHDALCKGSVNTAFRTLTGYTDADIAVDWANTKHVILYGRNLFESLELKPIQALMDAKDKGRQGHLHRHTIHDHGLPCGPLLDDQAGNRPRSQLCPDSRDSERESVRRGLCAPMGDRTDGAEGLCRAVHARVGGGRNRNPCGGNRFSCPGGEQGQAAGHLPLRLPWCQSHQRDLFPSLADYPERAHGKHREQGRTHHQEGAEGCRVMETFGKLRGPERSSQSESGEV